MKLSAAERRFRQEVRWCGKVVELETELVIARQLVKTGKLTWWKMGLYLTVAFPLTGTENDIRAQWWMAMVHKRKWHYIRYDADAWGKKILSIPATHSLLRNKSSEEAQKRKDGQFWLNLTQETLLSVSQD